MPQRTTLTLEDDVAARLRAEVWRTGKSFKGVVNDVLRAGLERGGPRRPERFKVAARNLGLRSEMEVDDVEGLLDRL